MLALKLKGYSFDSNKCWNSGRIWTNFLEKHVYLHLFCFFYLVLFLPYIKMWTGSSRYTTLANRKFRAQSLFIFYRAVYGKHLLSLVLSVTSHLIQEAFHKPASQLDTLITYFRVQVQVQVQVRVHNGTTSSLLFCIYLLFLQPTFRCFFQLFSTVLLKVTVTGIQTWCRLTLKSPIILTLAHSLSFYFGCLQLGCYS